ncbi:MAG: D-alanyl-D-alanine carboxypeptidase [Gammaproteobacteria bacterium]|nr:D-alanyl-D-alanine carboxypeptidase [Gammaproteobacteria bacterium]
MSSRSILLLLALASALSGPATAQPVVPAPPPINAKSWLVIDYQSRQILVQEKIDERVEPASLTKIMTVYVVASELAAGRAKLDDSVTVSERAWRMEGSKMFIEVGKQVSVADLLKGVIIQSGNDASVALAEYVAGSEEGFVAMMNSYGARLGMRTTHFANSDGLPDPDHYTTARDLATLAGALIRDFPDIYALHSIQEFTYNGITQRNRNDLLFDNSGVDGIKTGHHDTAGYCLIASAVRDGMRIITVVMGSNGTRSRAQATDALLNFAFRFYETHKIYSGNEKIAGTKVWKGAADSLDLGITEDLYVTVPRGGLERMQTIIDVREDVIAPVGKGAAQGMLRIQLDGNELTNRPLIALKEIPPGNLFVRLKDDVELLFH